MARSNEPTEEPTSGNRRNLNCSSRLKPSWMKMGKSKNISPYQSTTYKSTQVVPARWQDRQPNPFLHTCKKATLHFDTKNICALKSRVFFFPRMCSLNLSLAAALRTWRCGDDGATTFSISGGTFSIHAGLAARDRICMLFCLENQRRETGRYILASENTKEVNKTTKISFLEAVVGTDHFLQHLCFASQNVGRFKW